MKGSTRISMLAASVALATQAIAAEDMKEPNTRQYVAPMLHYLVLDEDRDLSRNCLLYTSDAADE